MRRKIEIKLIGDKSKRHTTFTKRRKGLTKKIEEYCRKSESMAVLIAFSAAGNCYIFGHPEVDAVLDRYEDGSAEAGSSSAEEAAVTVTVTEAEKRIGDALESGRWEEAVRGLGMDELDELSAELENIRRQMEAIQRKESGSFGGVLA